MHGGDIRSFYHSLFGDQSGPFYLGDRTGTRRSHASIREAWVTVQLVVSDPLANRQNDPSHGLALCHSLPAKAWGPACPWPGTPPSQEGEVEEPRSRRGDDTSARRLSCPQPVPAQALPAPASRAGQTVPGGCAVACGHCVCSRHLPPAPRNDNSEPWRKTQ